MGMKIYKNGAWVEPTFVRKYSNGAWVDCEFVKRYSNNSWVEVWSAGKKLKLNTTILGTGATYTLSASADNKTLNFSLNGAGDASNNVILAVNNPNGFGTSITIRYTLSQTLNDAYAGLYWLDGDRTRKMISHYSSIPNATAYNYTVTAENPTILFLLIDAWKSYKISGSIGNITINGEPIPFSV